ncbi:MAG: OmpA family protein [Lentisphaeria bacterium]|nr:OmpA family protein [Lentisphaeria bacterium]
MSKAMFSVPVVVLMLLVCGCGSTHAPEDTTAPVVEPAVDDPSGSLNAGAGDGFSALGGGAGQGPWVASERLAGNADADGWVPVDPKNRLNMPVIYFAYDSDVLVPSETANLDKIAAYLNQHTSLGLVIEGHCDSRGTDEYNRALGERRANAIRAYLAGRGVPDARMKTVSYGKDKPAVDGSGESIWRQNRRGVPVPMQIPGR